MWRPQNLSKLWQAMTGYDRLWQAMTGCDRLWQAVTGYDRLWQAMTGYDRLWQDMTGYDWLWQAVTGCDRLWQAVIGYDRLWQAITSYYRLWQAITGYAWLWQAVRGCDWLWQAVTGYDWLWQAVTGCDWLWQDVTGYDWLWQAVRGCDWLWQAMTGYDLLQQAVTGYDISFLLRMSHYHNDSCQSIVTELQHLCHPHLSVILYIHTTITTDWEYKKTMNASASVWINLPLEPKMHISVCNCEILTLEIGFSSLQSLVCSFTTSGDRQYWVQRGVECCGYASVITSCKEWMNFAIDVEIHYWQ